MTPSIHDILKQYWGYRQFRPSQEDIIHSVLSGKDTLGLMPTGGGKSICFQVPIMLNEGIGIVISPLISLMVDQVKNLKERGISAIALSSALSYREIDIGLENCVHGKYKFLYISPERLGTEIFLERIKRMTVNMVVVDEAHCISQWGYDFRPPYLKIKDLRSILHSTPILALTATATPAVVDDIQEKLGFDENNTIQQSFYRPKLYYNINHTEKKWSKTLEILKRIQGSTVIYLRNRKQTTEVSSWLNKNGFSSSYYHAGLSAEERDKRQLDWLNNKIRIIVCTNAFGMGIDKPDVRLVLHLDLPDSLEAYFQEAGRAGRDGNIAYSVVLIGPSDFEDLRRKNIDSFPDLAFVKRVYQSLSNYLQLASGGGIGQSYPFDITDFAKQYDFSIVKLYSTLKVLEKEGFITLGEAYKHPSRLFIKVDRTALYDYQLRNPKLDVFIKTLVRSYGGLEIEYGIISERLLAQRLNTSEKVITDTLNHLHQQGIVDYIASKGNARITFSQDRIAVGNLRVSDSNLKDRLNDRVTRIAAVEGFITNDNVCRSIQLLKYFGEDSEIPCGGCDVCRVKKLEAKHDELLDIVIEDLLTVLSSTEPLNIDSIKEQVKAKEQLIIEALRWLIDAEQVLYKDGKYFITKPQD